MILPYTRSVSRRFTLLDGAYYDALLLVSAALDDRGLAACLVGGGAAQAWISNLRTSGGELRLSEAPVLQTALRKTRDLDFATRTDSSTMLELLNGLARAWGTGAHVLGPRTLRLGGVSVSFTIEPDDLSGMAALYDAFLASRLELRLRRGAQADGVPTIGLEELLVTKLTRRGDRAKDVLDLVQIFAALRDAGRGADLGKVRSMVSERPDAVGLLDEITGRDSEVP